MKYYTKALNAMCTTDLIDMEMNKPDEYLEYCEAQAEGRAFSFVLPNTSEGTALWNAVMVKHKQYNLLFAKGHTLGVRTQPILKSLVYSFKIPRMEEIDEILKDYGWDNPTNKINKCFEILRKKIANDIDIQTKFTKWCINWKKNNNESYDSLCKIVENYDVIGFCYTILNFPELENIKNEFMKPNVDEEIIDNLSELGDIVTVDSKEIIPAIEDISSKREDEYHPIGWVDPSSEPILPFSLDPTRVDDWSAGLDPTELRIWKMRTAMEQAGASKSSIDQAEEIERANIMEESIKKLNQQNSISGTSSKTSKGKNKKESTNKHTNNLKEQKKMIEDMKNFDKKWFEEAKKSKLFDPKSLSNFKFSEFEKNRAWYQAVCAIELVTVNLAKDNGQCGYPFRLTRLMGSGYYLENEYHDIIMINGIHVTFSDPNGYYREWSLDPNKVLMDLKQEKTPKK